MAAFLASRQVRSVERAAGISKQRLIELFVH